MTRLVLVGLETQQGSNLSATGTMLLILAAFLLLVALDTMRLALSPLREVLKAFAAAGTTTILVLLAFAMVMTALIL